MTLNRLSILAALAAMTACAGPQAPINVDVHGFASDVVLGDQVRAVVDAPVGPISVTPPSRPGSLPPLYGPPIDGVVPTALPTSGPTATPDCPADDPLSTPRLEAGVSVRKPPVVGRYVFRSAGTFAAGESKGAFASSLTREVSDITRDPSGSGYVEFTVTSTMQGTSPVVERYRAVLENPVGPARVPAVTVTAPPAAPPTPLPSPTPTTVTTVAYAEGGPAVPGLYLLSRQAGAAVSVFNGNSGMLLVQFPVLSGERFRSSASDGAHTFDYISTARTDGRVNACGTPLSAWTLTLTGTIAQADPSVGPTVEFTSTQSIGPQYGGLVLAEHLERHNAAPNPVTVSEQLTTTINTEPKVPS
jgi:hypothetical protein